MIWPKQIAAEGWDNWSNAENEKTVYYVEYKNTGDGAAFNNRADWSKQLTGKEAKLYTLENIFTPATSPAITASNWFQQIRTNKFMWPVQTFK